MAFAEGTSVPVSRTRGEIEALVEKYGARNFVSGWTDTTAGISFAIHGRLVRFELHMPTMEVAKRKVFRRYTWIEATEAQCQKWMDAEKRRLWRCLLLAIKAKLEVVESGIATFEQEFLGHIVTAENMTIYEALRTQTSTSGQRLLPPVEEP
jgi:hypothetical protein